MLDVVRLGFFVAAFIASVQARFGWGVLATVVGILVLATEVGLVLRYPLEPMPVQMVLGSLFLGMSALPHVPPVAATAIMTDPLHHVVLAGMGALVARSAFARSGELPNDGLPSRRLDAVGLRFVALAVVHALMAISGLLFHVLAKE